MTSVKPNTQQIDISRIDVFQKYYISLFPELKYFVCKYIDDQELAVDMIQDLWMKIWERKMLFVNELTLKTYLYHSLRNTSFNHLRDSDNKPSLLEETEHDTTADNSPDMLSEMIESEIYSDLNAAFSELSDSCRAVYVRSLQGKSQKEIAEQLNISINTVKKHINNANHYLRSRLKDLYLWLFLSF